MDRSAHEGARPPRDRAVGGIEQPFVGPKGTMHPQRVVERRELKSSSAVGNAVRLEGRDEQSVVRRIGKYRLVNPRLIREPADRAKPRAANRLALLCAQ